MGRRIPGGQEMKYHLIFRRRAQKEINRLPSDIRTNVKKMLNVLRDNPFPDGFQRIHGHENHFRIKVGRQYRIVYEFVKNTVIITIVKVGHRKDVYRNI